MAAGLFWLQAVLQQLQQKRWAAAQLQQKPRGRWCCRVPCRTLNTTNQVCEQGFESPLTFSLQCNWSGGCFKEAVTCCSWFCSGQKEGAGISAASLQRHPMRQDFPGKGKSKLFLRHRHQACQVWPAKAKKKLRIVLAFVWLVKCFEDAASTGHKCSCLVLVREESRKGGLWHFSTHRFRWTASLSIQKGFNISWNFQNCLAVYKTAKYEKGLFLKRYLLVSYSESWVVSDMLRTRIKSRQFKTNLGQNSSHNAAEAVRFWHDINVAELHRKNQWVPHWKVHVQVQVFLANLAAQVAKNHSSQ